MNDDGHRRTRSYVLRTTRMTPAQRAALDRGAAEWCIEWTGEEPPQPLTVNAIFGRTPEVGDVDGGSHAHEVGHSHSDRPRLLDIGFGMGRQLIAYAIEHPETDIIGCEVHKPGVGRVLAEIESAGISNVRILRHDVSEAVERLFAPEQFDRVHIFFPDPWPKKRHHKRRLIEPEFTVALTRVLRAGGVIVAATDWEDYALQMLEVFSATAGLRNRYEGFAPRQTWRAETEFERKGIAKGHTIRELVFERA